MKFTSGTIPASSKNRDPPRVCRSPEVVGSNLRFQAQAEGRNGRAIRSNCGRTMPGNGRGSDGLTAAGGIRLGNRRNQWWAFLESALGGCATQNPRALVRDEKLRDARRESSELAVTQNTRLGQRVFPVRGELQRRGGIHGQAVNRRGELMFGIEYVIKSDQLAGVAGHASH